MLRQGMIVRLVGGTNTKVEDFYIKLVWFIDDKNIDGGKELFATFLKQDQRLDVLARPVNEIYEGTRTL